MAQRILPLHVSTTSTPRRNRRRNPPSPGYFSFFKSFISVEHDSTCRDREGIVLAIVDELSDYEILDLLIEMKKINDRSVKDVSLILL